MKLKKVLTAILTGALVLSTMGAAASANVSNANGNDADKYEVNVIDSLPDGCTPSDVYGISFSFDEAITDDGMGGGIAWNSDSSGWKQTEWGTADKPVEITSNDVKFVNDTALFTDADEWAQLFVCHWGWGGDITVKNVTVLGKDGKALAAKATDDAAADSDDAAADTDDTAEETPEADNNKKTSDLNLTYVYLLLAAAAGSLVVVNVRRKRA